MFCSPLQTPLTFLFWIISASQVRVRAQANYGMSCLSNSKAFVPWALRLIGLCGFPESRCYIIDAVSFFSVYRQYMNKPPPLWHKRWDSVDAYDCVCLSTTCSHFFQFSSVPALTYPHTGSGKELTYIRKPSARPQSCRFLWIFVEHRLRYLFLFPSCGKRDVPRRCWAVQWGAQAHMPQQKEGCGSMAGASLSWKWNTTGK